MLPAVPAAVGHGPMVFALRDMDGTAVRANNPVWPAFLLEVFAGRFFVGELLEKLVEADGFGLVGFHWYVPQLLEI